MHTIKFMFAIGESESQRALEISKAFPFYILLFLINVFTINSVSFKFPIKVCVLENPMLRICMIFSYVQCVTLSLFPLLMQCNFVTAYVQNLNTWGNHCFDGTNVLLSLIEAIEL